MVSCFIHELGREAISGSAAVRGTVGEVECGTPLRGLEITLFQTVLVGTDIIFHCVCEAAIRLNDVPVKAS